MVEHISRDMYKRLLLILLLLLQLGKLSATNSPFYYIKNYSIEDYGGSCQNWGFSLNADGLLFVANNSGLLEFNGNSWQLYPLPDNAPAIGVTNFNDTIYTKTTDSVIAWSFSNTGILQPHAVNRLPDSVKFDPQPVVIPFSLPTRILDAQPTCYGFTGSYYLIGTRKGGLFVLTKTGQILEQITMQNRLADNMIHALVVQDYTQVWLALDNGISQISFNPPLFLLGDRSHIGKLEKAGLTDNELILSTSLGYFRRELEPLCPFIPIEKEEAMHFLKENPMWKSTFFTELIDNKESLGSFAQADQIYYGGDSLYWLTLKNEVGLFHISEGKGTLKCRLLFDNYGYNLVTQGKKIFTLNESLVLFSTMQGIVLVNIRDLIANSITPNYTPIVITSLSYWESGKIKQLPIHPETISLPHNFQEFTANIGTSIFTLNHYISYKIEGVSSEWSSWQQGGSIRFLQLPEGRYRLKVRKYVVQGPFPELTLDIIVYPPWYNSFWAWLAYIAIVVLLAHQILRFNLRTLHREEEQKAEESRFLKQQQLDALKHELLQAELQNNNNDLMLQTTALVKRNQTLQLLLDELDKQKETLGDRYPNKLYNRLRKLMEESLNDQTDWVQFETYFNSAHKNVIERLRTNYAELTQGDLRICCLLRMNLSTKEIASLMNVSIRAVELRRYRLRKRLLLDSDTNLIDFLIRF